MEINVDAVETNQEVDKGIFLLGGDMGEEGRGNGFARREGLSNGKVENKSFGINISDIDTSLMGKEDRISLTSRGDADIVLGVGWMGEERLNNEVVEGSGDRFDLMNIASVTCIF